MPCCSRKKTYGKELQSIKSESDEQIEYSITIKTGDRRNCGTNGPVYIKIFGRDNKQTDEILLSSSFSYDSIKKVQIKTIDIGKPQRILIRHEDKTNGWFLDYIEILVHNFLIRFLANRWLSESKHDRKLFAELFGSEQPAVDYNIEIRTGSEQSEVLDSPVYMQIYGTITTTPKMFLESKNASFTKDSIAKFQISSNHVGEIQKIVIGHENLGIVNEWYLQSVKVQTGEQEYEFFVNKCLSPTKELFVELHPQSSRKLEKYLITIKTIDIQRTNAIDNIRMSICGSNGQIEKMLLKECVKSNEQELFQKGNLDEFEIQEKDIGNIESITIGFDDNEGQGALLLEFIDIKYKEKLYHFRVDYWLLSRFGSNFSWVTITTDTNNDDIDYKVIIDIGESDIQANVMLCIYGDKNLTKYFALRRKKDNIETKFNKNNRLEFHLKGIDVGKIQKINIGYNRNNIQQKWFIKSIEIDKKDEHYIFNANRSVNESMDNFIDLLPEEESKSLLPEKDLVEYIITIVTSSEEDSGTDSGVHMAIYGDKDQTKQFYLTKTEQNSELLFKPNEIKQFEFQLNDVGHINKINIGQDGKGLHPIWHLQSVEIQKGSETYKFYANQVLDFSMPNIDLTPISPGKPSSPEPIPPTAPRNSTTMSTYKILARFHPLHQSVFHNEANPYIILIGKNNKTEKLFLSNRQKGEIEYHTIDVGKISKIRLGQNVNPHGIVWYVDCIRIQHGNQIITCNIERSIEQNTEIEIKPSEISTIVVKTKDTDYKIKTTTGDKPFDGNVITKIRGDCGIIVIPLTTTESGAKPFQTKAIDVFTSRTTDVGKIKRIIIDINPTDKDQIFYLKKIQIIRGNETTNFNGNVRLDERIHKVTLYPIEVKKEDYVQTELRRLREGLRTESAKRRRPPHKAHEPYVYNDLSPYFDTTTVEKAIQEPLEMPPGYYTRVTALRIVEPWEAFGMDYGVSYELLKQKKARGYSAKRLSSTQNGLMMLPPLSLPYGGQITHVNHRKFNTSRSSSSTKKRSVSRQKNDQHSNTTTTA